MKALVTGGTGFIGSHLVKGLELAAKKEKAAGEIYIITDGKPLTLNQLFIIMAKVLEIDPPDKHVPIWMAKNMAFLSEMKARLTGGSPNFTLKQTIDFYRENGYIG